LAANKIGVFTVQIFGIPYLLHALLNVDLPILTAQMYTICGFVMAASVAVIIASSIIQRRGIGAVLWLFDLTGILGDIMSYARLAGVGLATFYLASSFNMLAVVFSDMIPGLFGLIIGVIIAIVVLILGHGINLVLSGLTGFVHSLRLCFVEFLTKFYEGGGREYSPFKLKTRAYVPVRG